MRKHEHENRSSNRPSFLQRAFQLLFRSRSSRYRAATNSASDFGDRPMPDETLCGGYNEAFILQYWTGYNPRH